MGLVLVKRPQAVSVVVPDNLLSEFADYVPDGSLCGFGWNATNPLKTAMRYYADDFQKHLRGECPTGTCVPVRTHRFA